MMDLIFLSPLFKVQKTNRYLGIQKFRSLTLNDNKKFIALGGINKKNIQKIKLLNCYGFAAISYINDMFAKK